MNDASASLVDSSLFCLLFTINNVELRVYFPNLGKRSIIDCCLLWDRIIEFFYKNIEQVKFCGITAVEDITDGNYIRKYISIHNVDLSLDIGDTSILPALARLDPLGLPHVWPRQIGYSAKISGYQFSFVSELDIYSNDYKRMGYYCVTVSILDNDSFLFYLPELLVNALLEELFQIKVNLFNKINYTKVFCDIFRHILSGMFNNANEMQIQSIKLRYLKLKNKVCFNLLTSLFDAPSQFFADGEVLNTSRLSERVLKHKITELPSVRYLLDDANLIFDHAIAQVCINPAYLADLTEGSVILFNQY